MEQGINMYGANRESNMTSGVMHEVYAFIIDQVIVTLLSQWLSPLVV